mgnify:CR=1 FL=1
MEKPKFEILNYINKYNDDFEKFKQEIYKLGVMSKDYPEEGLVLLYNNYGNTNNLLDGECRSVVLNRETMEIVSFTCNSPLCNSEAINFIMENNESEKIITECYEGTMMSIFKHKEKWYISTRRCLDSNNSVWQQEKSHYKMFVEVLKDNNYESFDQFTDKLSEEFCYNFILLHHENKNVVDYTNVFGENYKKLVLAIVREKSTQKEINIWNNEDINNFEKVLNDNIFIPKKLDNFNLLDVENQKNYLDNPPRTEGLIVKVMDGSNNFKVLKIQTNDYQFGCASGSTGNIYRGFLKLYQNEKLNDFFKNNKNFDKYSKIINPLNTSETYDTIGMVDAVFKVCTSELFELFKILWDIKTGKHKTGNLYNKLSKDYRDILFGIRGIYFKKKASYINDKKENNLNKNYYLKIKDIYTYLKKTSTEKVEGMLRNRKLMYNWAKMNPEKDFLKDFSKISEKCDKVHFKLTAIFTNKIFPDIMPDDIPFQDE